MTSFGGDPSQDQPREDDGRFALKNTSPTDPVVLGNLSVITDRERECVVAAVASMGSDTDRHRSDFISMRRGGGVSEQIAIKDWDVAVSEEVGRSSAAAKSRSNARMHPSDPPKNQRVANERVSRFLASRSEELGLPEGAQITVTAQNDVAIDTDNMTWMYGPAGQRHRNDTGGLALSDRAMESISSVVDHADRQSRGWNGPPCTDIIVRDEHHRAVLSAQRDEIAAANAVRRGITPVGTSITPVDREVFLRRLESSDGYASPY